MTVIMLQKLKPSPSPTDISTSSVVLMLLQLFKGFSCEFLLGPIVKQRYLSAHWRSLDKWRDMLSCIGDEERNREAHFHRSEPAACFSKRGIILTSTGCILLQFYLVLKCAELQIVFKRDGVAVGFPFRNVKWCSRYCDVFNSAAVRKWETKESKTQVCWLLEKKLCGDIFLCCVGKSWILMCVSVKEKCLIVVTKCSILIMLQLLKKKKKSVSTFCGHKLKTGTEGGTGAFLIVTVFIMHISTADPGALQMVKLKKLTY